MRWNCCDNSVGGYQLSMPGVPSSIYPTLPLLIAAIPLKPYVNGTPSMTTSSTRQPRSAKRLVRVRAAYRQTEATDQKASSSSRRASDRSDSDDEEDASFAGGAENVTEELEGLPQRGLHQSSEMRLEAIDNLAQTVNLSKESKQSLNAPNQKLNTTKPAATAASPSSSSSSSTSNARAKESGGGLLQSLKGWLGGY
jgi:hypothetical protein